MSGMFRAPPGCVFIWLIRVVPGDILRGSIRQHGEVTLFLVYSIATRFMATEARAPVSEGSVPARGTRSSWRRDTYLSVPLFVVVTCLLVFVVAALGSNLYFQHQNYRMGIQKALDSPRIDHAVVLTYSRSWDFAVVKTSSIFLGFSLILIGALYVLRVAESRFSMSVESNGTKGSLESSSPGLIMLVLGVVLVALVLYSKSTVELAASTEQDRTIPSQQLKPSVPQLAEEKGPVITVPKDRKP